MYVAGSGGCFCFCVLVEELSYLKGSELVEEKKRKQHFVFQAYLDAWKDKGKIHCCRDWGVPFSGSTERVANIRDFYRLKPLNDDEERFYCLLIQNYPDDVKNALLQHLISYVEPIKWQQQLNFLRRLSEARFNGNIPEELETEIARLEKFVDATINNLDEDYMSELEGESKKWLDALKNKSSDFYYEEVLHIEGEPYDDESFHFLYFLCVQMFRTDATKERWIAGFKPSLDHPDLEKLKVSRENIDLENLVPHFFWEFQNLLAYNLRKNKAHLTILINESSVPYITSDQPVINLKADYSNIGAEIEEMVLYYPISPKIAITVNDNNSERIITLSENDVRSYNSIIAKASYHEVYGDSKTILMEIAEEMKQ